MRSIEHNECEPRWNMAVDCAILEAVEQGMAPDTLRLYRWDRETISLGAHQNANLVAEITPESRNPVIVRRPTGGAAVVHSGDQTLSVILSRNGRVGDLTAKRAYSIVREGLSIGLNRLGLIVSPCGNTPSRPLGPDCFATLTEVDLSVDGKKLVGLAVRSRRGAILVQGSLIYRNGASPHQDPVTGTGWHPLAEIEPEDLEAAIQTGISEAFGATLQGGELSMWELERAAFLMQSMSA